MTQKTNLAKAMVITASGEVKTHYFKGSQATLKEMQELVNGPIERISIGDNQTMFLNEEWHVFNQSLNKAAISFLLRNNLPGYLVGGDVFIISNNFYN